MSFREWKTYSLASMLLAGSHALYAAQPMLVFGVEGARTIQPNGKHNGYQLQLASFSSQSNAQAYQRKLQQQLKAPVQITESKGNVVYYRVSVGPLSSVEALHHVSRQLSHQATPFTQRSAKKAMVPVRLVANEFVLPKNPLSSATAMDASVMPASPLVEKPVAVKYKEVKKTVTHPSPKLKKSKPVEPIQPPAASVELNSIFPASTTGLVTLSLGPTWESAGQQQTFYVQNQVENTYTADKLSHHLVDGELFLALERRFFSRLDLQLGLALAQTNSAGISGNIWADADPEFNNLSYGYSVQHSHAAFKTKFLMESWYAVKPYLGASVGVGFNRSSNFTNTALIEEVVPQPNFGSHTVNAFTYTAEAGLQRMITAHWQTGLGYQFADWGKSQLARAPTQVMGRSLELSHLYTNGVMFNATYIY